MIVIVIENIVVEIDIEKESEIGMKINLEIRES